MIFGDKYGAGSSRSHEGGMKRSAAVLGGGISGLAAARHLALNGFQVTVLEKTSRVGGWVLGERLDNGILFERGPHSMRPRRVGNGRRIVELVEELRLDKEALVSRGSDRYVFAHDKLIRLPSSLKEVFRNPLTRKLPPRIALEALGASYVNAPDAKLGEFIERKFGPDAKLLLTAMVAGIFAGDVDELSVKSCFPDMIKYNNAGFGSFVRGLFLAPRAKDTASANRLNSATGITFPDGMMTMVKRLEQECAELGVHFLTGAQVKELRRDRKTEVWTAYYQQSGGRTDQAYTSDLVVSTLHPRMLASLFSASSLEQRLSDLTMHVVSKIGKVDVAVVNLSFPTAEVHLPARGFGYLVAEKAVQQSSGCLGVIFDSVAFPEQQPPEYAVVSVMLGGANAPWISQKTEPELIELARQALANHMYLGCKPVNAAAILHRDCIPQFRIGHSGAALELITEAERHNMVVGGTGVLGAGMADSVGGLLRTLEEKFGLSKRRQQTP